jgi:hypothetical protein
MMHRPTNHHARSAEPIVATLTSCAGDQHPRGDPEVAVQHQLELQARPAADPAAADAAIRLIGSHPEVQTEELEDASLEDAISRIRTRTPEQIADARQRAEAAITPGRPSPGGDSV